MGFIGEILSVYGGGAGYQQGYRPSYGRTSTGGGAGGNEAYFSDSYFGGGGGGGGGSTSQSNVTGLDYRGSDSGGGFI